MAATVMLVICAQGGGKEFGIEDLVVESASPCFWNGAHGTGDLSGTPHYTMVSHDMSFT